jgi:hypothetical protein
MPLRRRPVLRAAAVGGIGYAVGKSAAQKAAPQQGMPAAPEQAPPSPQPAPPASAPPAQPSQTERIKALADLKGLLDSGAVTQAEFDQAKKGLLEGSG